MENQIPQNEEKKIDRFIRRKTIVAFIVLTVGLSMVVALWRWLQHQPTEDGVLKPLRSVLSANEKVNDKLFNKNHLAKEYPKSKAAKKVRVNGDLGLGDDFEAEKWKLTVNRHLESAEDRPFNLSMADIKTFPKHDIVFDFKCIEGWDQVTHWGGVNFLDFMIKYKLGTHSGKAPDPKHPEDLYKYVGLLTPDSAYYVGIDMKSMMHPQTILCYELNERPLSYNQGAPLRLIITVKYGVKSLKRIGAIFFSDTKPKDYWFENGYDYDSAL